MDFELTPFASGLMQKQAVDEIIECNDYTAQFGLTLTQSQALELVETRSTALRNNGRIEFGGGMIDKIIKAFCDSPYISTESYIQTIQELLEIFYYYKNETMDIISDDELIELMKLSFHGICQGSLEMLAEQELYHLGKSLRFGLPSDDSKSDFSQDEEENDE